MNLGSIECPCQDPDVALVSLNDSDDSIPSNLGVGHFDQCRHCTGLKVCIAAIDDVPPKFADQSIKARLPRKEHLYLGSSEVFRDCLRQGVRGAVLHKDGVQRKARNARPPSQKPMRYFKSEGSALDRMRKCHVDVALRRLAERKRIIVPIRLLPQIVQTTESLVNPHVGGARRKTKVHTLFVLDPSTQTHGHASKLICRYGFCEKK